MALASTSLVYRITFILEAGAKVIAKLSYPHSLFSFPFLPSTRGSHMRVDVSKSKLETKLKSKLEEIPKHLTVGCWR